MPVLQPQHGSLGWNSTRNAPPPTAGLFGGINFSQIGFGSPNAYTLALNASQNLFTGGRITGQMQVATAGRRAAQIEMSAQRAQLILDVTQAYYAAALSGRLLQIAQASLQQAEDQLKQTQLQQRVGNGSEFDLLRATVSRDNQRPIVIQRQSDRQIAYLQLEQLLHLPLDRPLRLTTSIEDTTAVPPGVQLAPCGVARYDYQSAGSCARSVGEREGTGGAVAGRSVRATPFARTVVRVFTCRVSERRHSGLGELLSQLDSLTWRVAPDLHWWARSWRYDGSRCQLARCTRPFTTGS